MQGSFEVSEDQANGYTNVVLDRLAMHIRRALRADKSFIFVRDESAPDCVVTVAGSGIPRERIGERQVVDGHVVGYMLAANRPVLLEDFRRLPWINGEPDGASGGAAPIRWQGRLRGAVAASTEAGVFGERELEILIELSELTAAALRHCEQHEFLEPRVEAGVEALAAAIDMRDGYTSAHSSEVVQLAAEVGRKLALGPATMVELKCAARLHDVGKIAVPDRILRKPGPLDAEEWNTIRTHPEQGAEVLSRIPGLEAVASIVRFHHECWDGSGYPDGLSGEAIPLASRVIAACDALRAMTSNRPYRRAMPCAAALGELERHAGTQFDPGVVSAVIGLV